MATLQKRESAIEALISSLPKGLLIDGNRVPALSGRTFETIDPTTETIITRVAELGAEDTDLAVGAVRRAFDNPNWSAVAPQARSTIRAANRSGCAGCRIFC